MIRIEAGDLFDQRVTDLIAAHVSRARAETAPGQRSRAGFGSAAGFDDSILRGFR